MKQRIKGSSELPLATESASKSMSIARAEEVICAATATSGKALAGRILAQLQSFQIGQSDFERRLNLALDALAGLQPTSTLESLLAVQMLGAHEAAVMFLRNAIADDQSPEGRDANLMRSTKLMGLFIEQLEAMQKLRGKPIQQKVTVEHVHVHDGGKAIVGSVSVGEKAQQEEAEE